MDGDASRHGIGRAAKYLKLGSGPIKLVAFILGWVIQAPEFQGCIMSNPFWLTDEQMACLQPCFPKSHGKPGVDDRHVLSGIIFINRNGLRWSDAPRGYRPPKTLYNRWKRWSDMGVFARSMTGLAAERTNQTTIMIDATCLKAHRTASSLRLKTGAWQADWQDERWHEHKTARRHRQSRTPDPVLHICWQSQRLHRGQSPFEQPSIGRPVTGRSWP